MPEDITQTVLARDEVVQYLRGSDGGASLTARQRVEGYLDKLRTTQRYSIDEAVDAAIALSAARGVLAVEHGRRRVCDRSVLRYYERSLDHLLESPLRRAH